MSKATGGGTLSGTLTGSIATSANSVTISTPVYSKSDTMTLTATATTGETSLTAATSGNIVFSAGPATHLAFTSVPITGTVGTAFSVTVQSQDANGNPSNPTSATTITLSKASGSGTLSGTLTGSIATTTNSVTISTPVYSAADTLTLTATATAGETGLTAATSGGIVFADAFTIVATGINSTLGEGMWINESNTPVNAYFAGVILITVSNTVTHQAWSRETLCVDLFTDIGLNNWYGTTILSPATVTGKNLPRVAWLVDNALVPPQNTNFSSQLPPSDWATNAAMGAGLQLAVWDIVEDGGDGLYSGSVQASTGTATPAAVIFWATNYEALSLGKASDSAYVYNNVVVSSGAPAQMLLGPEYSSTNGPAPAATFSIGNLVFYDANNNGFLDGGEPGIPNVVMDLYAADGSGNPTGSAVATTITDANGYYRFDGLLAGTYVAVVDVIGSGTNLNGMITSTGWSTNLALAGDNQDHGIDTPLGGLSVLPGGIASVPVTVGIGLQPTGEATFGAGAGANGPNGDANDNLVVDFGFTGNASIAGSVLVDVNGNGIADSNDTSGIAGVTVTLQTTGGVVLASTLTSASGAYSFPNLLPGSYVVVETNLPGWISTLDTAPPNDDHIPVTLTSGQVSTGNNFYDTQLAQITGSVKLDVNGNGIADGNDTNGVSPVVITVYQGGTNLVATVTNNSDGTFSVSNLTPGSYSVVQTVPPGYMNTTPVTVNVTLTSGSAGTANYLDTQLGSIAGSVLVDVNGNGIADSNDTNGIAGVTVTLQTTGGVVLASTLTSASGAYSFTNLLPGSYMVVETNLPGWISTLDTAPPNDDHIPVTLTSGQVSTGNNFYDMQLAQIVGSVKLDVNGNGTADLADTNGISPVVIKIYQGGANLVATVTNNPDGSFAVSGLLPGNYTVLQTVPANLYEHNADDRQRHADQRFDRDGQLPGHAHLQRRQPGVQRQWGGRRHGEQRHSGRHRTGNCERGNEALCGGRIGQSHGQHAGQDKYRCQRILPL